MGTRHIHNERELKPRRQQLRTAGTPAEAVLWKNLSRSKLLGKKFRRQHSIGPYVVDFYCPECELVVELDGAGHFGPTAQDHESQRTKYLEGVGVRIVRFENRAVFERLDAVLETIRQVLLNEERKPHTDLAYFP